MNKAEIKLEQEKLALEREKIAIQKRQARQNLFQIIVGVIIVGCIPLVLTLVKNRNDINKEDREFLVKHRDYFEVTDPMEKRIRLDQFRVLYGKESEFIEREIKQADEEIIVQRKAAEAEKERIAAENELKKAEKEKKLEAEKKLADKKRKEAEAKKIAKKKADQAHERAKTILKKLLHLP